jgi:hypothetical protein
MRLFFTYLLIVPLFLLSGCGNNDVVDRLSSDSNLNGVSNKTKNLVEAVRLVEGINNTVINGNDKDINKAINEVIKIYNDNNIKEGKQGNEIKIENGILYTSHDGEFEITILETMVVLGERIK